jgi:hypothetical protein
MALVGDRYGGSISGRVQSFCCQAHTPTNRSLSCTFIARERAH